MSMIESFRLISPEQLVALHADPQSIEDLLADDPVETSGAEADLCIDKAWHGIHFLLTGTESGGSPPLDFLVAGGRAVGDVDVGYGPGRTFSNDALAEINSALRPLTPELLSGRYDAKRMLQLEIYPEIWGDPAWRDDALAYLLQHFVTLKRFIERGASDGRALLVTLS